MKGTIPLIKALHELIFIDLYHNNIRESLGDIHFNRNDSNIGGFPLDNLKIYLEISPQRVPYDLENMGLPKFDGKACHIYTQNHI